MARLERLLKEKSFKPIRRNKEESRCLVRDLAFALSVASVVQKDFSKEKTLSHKQLSYQRRTESLNRLANQKTFCLLRDHPKRHTSLESILDRSKIYTKSSKNKTMSTQDEKFPELVSRGQKKKPCKYPQLRQLIPLNEKDEKENFLSLNGAYNPQFIYSGIECSSSLPQADSQFLVLALRILRNQPEVRNCANDKYLDQFQLSYLISRFFQAVYT